MLKIITDSKINDCSQCPLKPGYTRDCGTIRVEKIEHGQKYTKKPNALCKVKYE